MKMGGGLLVLEADVGRSEGPAEVGRVKGVFQGEDAPYYRVVESVCEEYGVSWGGLVMGGLCGRHSHADVVGDYGQVSA